MRSFFFQPEIVKTSVTREQESGQKGNVRSHPPNIIHFFHQSIPRLHLNCTDNDAQHARLLVYKHERGVEAEPRTKPHPLLKIMSQWQQWSLIIRPLVLRHRCGDRKKSKEKHNVPHKLLDLKGTDIFKQHTNKMTLINLTEATMRRRRQEEGLALPAMKKKSAGWHKMG